MKDFDEEIFEYLTEDKDRFRYAHEIHQLFPQIEERLIDGFWNLVKQKLTEETRDSEWVVISDDDYTERYSKLGIYLFSKDLRVIYEALHGQPYYGIWIDAKSSNLDRKRVYEYVGNELNIPKDMKGPDHGYWLAQGDVQDDFRSLQTLRRMLPKKGHKMAEEYASELYALAKKWKDNIEVILKERIS